MRPKTLIEYANVEQPDYYSPTPAEVVAAKLEQAAKTASQTFLESKRQNMQFQLQMEDRRIKREDATAKIEIARRQMENQEDSSVANLINQSNPADDTAMKAAINALQNPTTKQIYSDYYTNTTIPTLRRKDFLEGELENKSVNEILKHTYENKEGEIISGKQILDEYAGMLKKKDSELISLNYDSGVQLKIEEYNKNRGVYDLVSSDILTKSVKDGGFGLEEQDVKILQGVVGSNELENTLIDMIKVKNPGRFNTKLSEQTLKASMGMISSLNQSIEKNTAEINANTRQIAEDTTLPGDVLKFQESNQKLEQQSKVYRSQRNILMKQLNFPVGQKIVERKIDGVRYNVTVNETTGDEISREKIIQETQAEKIAREKEEARLTGIRKKQKEAKEAERLAKEAERAKAWTSASAQDSIDAGDITSSEDALSLGVPQDIVNTLNFPTAATDTSIVAEPVVRGEDSVTTTPSGLTYSNVYQPEPVTKTEPDTVLNTVAKETMTASEKRVADINKFIPNDLNRSQLQRLVQSGELSTDQLIEVGKFLEAHSGKEIKTARNNRELRNLIKILYKRT